MSDSIALFLLLHVTKKNKYQCSKKKKEKKTTRRKKDLWNKMTENHWDGAIHATSLSLLTI